MNFTDALMTTELVLESGAVPLLIGESGIGKTALIKKLCSKKEYYSIVIDGNMLKEGEIGGLPTVEEYRVYIDGKEERRKRTVYAVHTKLQEIDKALSEKPEMTILLFIDEINRCEHTVQQELMNIILNREINGYRLPENVFVAAAMNPSNKYEKYSGSDYQVVDMDPAQEDRFVWIELEAEVKTWLAWGVEEGNIQRDVLEFISSFPEYLHTPYSNEMVKATPRSWERVSNSYKVYLKKKDRFPSKILLNIIRGNVGGSIAQEFYNFIENSKNPLITPEDIFNETLISEEMKARVKRESHSRLYMAAKNILHYIKDSEDKKDKVRIFSEFIQNYPQDLKIGIMREIKEGYEESIYKDFLDDDSFIEGFFQIYNEVEG
ncbi:AAA family ATPase [Clostridium sp. YIM B02515]|uniref:AAA family ATPase n=1 Tax=Clostridium rhizosphaerae TaxID=2803861 RepID=A0ABS1T7U5_9CLOT|nr:AAA family ATPase [Clostridium rhizosphaerae]MBL4935414.1 AAA family ATPase [Clostridium rhizosphaerae]